MFGGTPYAFLAVASLSVATPAVAAQPDGGRYVWVPAGTEAIPVPTGLAAPTDFPVASTIASRPRFGRRAHLDIHA